MMLSLRTTKPVKRILLVEPPRTVADELMKRTRPAVQPPMGLAYVAATLEKNGYDVRILDAIVEDKNCAVGTQISKGMLRYGISDEEIEQRIRKFAPDIVGVTCLVSAKYHDAKNICRIAKKVDPDCVTMMGGAHPTLNTAEVMEDPDLDFVVLGEGDFSSVELVRYIEGKLSLEQLDGIALKLDGTVRVIPKTKYIENLDDVPFPAHHLLPLRKYWEYNLPHGETSRSPWTTIVTSRGCPASCIYCSASLLWGKKYRARSAENVLKEIEMLIKEYGIKELLIEDDNFTFNKERTEKILDGIIEKGWDLTWTTPSGVAIFALDANLLKKIKQSGCTSMTLAVESGSQRVLSRVVKKPVSLKKVEEVVTAAKSLGIKTKAFFMLGIPGETKEEMRSTLDLARKLKVDWSCFSITSPLPGTELYEICKRNKYIEEDLDPDKILFVKANITTDQFNPDFVNEMWDEANNINFLENPNLMENGNVDQAIRDFNRVIRMVPHHELAHLCLGIAYEKKSMISEAVEEWQTVLTINSENASAKEYIAKYKLS